MPEALPFLLVLNKLVKPLRKIEAKFHELTARLAEADDKDTLLVQGIAVLGLSHFEVGLADCLRYYLTHFPQKLKGAEVKFSKEVFLRDQFALLERAIDIFLQDATYKNFQEYIDLAKEVLSIDLALPTEALDLVREFRARRNLLLHANLVVNDRYLTSAVPLTESSYRGRNLKMECDYVMKGLAGVSALVVAIRTSLEAKYEGYTKLRAARELWQYLFQSPIMQFDDYWSVDETKDTIRAMCRPKCEATISSGERLLLGLWRSHFNGTSDGLEGFNMRRFDSDSRMMVHYFLAWAPDFDFY
jgi:hypothetical protein